MLKSVFSRLEVPVACVVHVGAGAGGDLPVYTGAGARRIILAEADPECAAELRARLRDTQGVEIVQAAVSGDTTPRPFHRTSYSELSSLRAPAGLRDLFPGLRIVSEKPVAPVDPATLIAEMDAADGPCALVLEAPGEALGILQALDGAGKLHDFGLICLREGREALYDGAPPLDEIRDWLEAADYRTETEAGATDPDRPWLAAWRDAARAALRQEVATLTAETARLGQALSDAEAARARLRSERDEAREKIAGLTAAGDRARKETAETRTALETLTAEKARLDETLKQETGRLTGERDAARERNAKLTEERDQARKDAEQARTELETLRAENARLDETLKQETGRLTGERDAARNRNAKLTEEHTAAVEAAEAEAARQRSRGRDEIMKAEGQIRLLRDLLLNRDAL